MQNPCQTNPLPYLYGHPVPSFLHRHRYYVFGVVICPMVFYIPKFFELKTVYSPYSIRTVVDCASIIQPPPADLRGETPTDIL